MACLGYLMPSSFLSDLGERPQDWRDGAECGIGIANAISRLEDHFVGDEECAMWCPGPTYLESLAEDPEQAMKVYAELVRRLAPIMRLKVATNEIWRMRSLLKEVGETVPSDMLSNEIPRRHVDAPGQMYLSFDD